MEEVCEAPPTLLTYSLQMEWLGVDGVTRVNNSVRVEWWGTESRAVCEMLPEPQTDLPHRVSDFEFTGHCCRCVLQLLAFTAFVVVLARSTGFKIIRPASYRCQTDQTIIVDYGDSDPTPQRLPESVKRVSIKRRCSSASAILQHIRSDSSVISATRLVLFACQVL